MKARTKAASALALVVSLLSACGGSGDGNLSPTPTLPNGATISTITAVIDGVPYSAVDTSSVIAGSIAIGSYDPATRIVGVGGIDSKSLIQILISGTPTSASGYTGTYTVTNAAMKDNKNNGREWDLTTPGSATFKVTSFTSTRMTGTFSFDVVPSDGQPGGVRHVTNGTFDVVSADVSL